MLCRVIALEAQQLQNQGVSIPQIKKTIDDKYAR